MDKVKICTPISHLFKNSDFAKSIISNSDVLECRDHTINNISPNQEVFHCDIQPIHNFSDSDYLFLEKIKKLKKNLRLISFHLASCYKNPKLKQNIFQSNGKKLSRSKLLDNAKKNIDYIKNFFGQSVKIAVENNNFMRSEAYDYVTDPNFISSVVKENEIYFLFDISHARISSYNMGINYSDYIKYLPMKKTIQLHISKEVIKSNGVIYDAHEIPDSLDIKEIKRLLKQYSGIKYLTLEYYKDINELINFLRNLKNSVNEK